MFQCWPHVPVVAEIECREMLFLQQLVQRVLKIVATKRGIAAKAMHDALRQRSLPALAFAGSLQTVPDLAEVIGFRVLHS